MCVYRNQNLLEFRISKVFEEIYDLRCQKLQGITTLSGSRSPWAPSRPLGRSSPTTRFNDLRILEYPRWYMTLGRCPSIEYLLLSRNPSQSYDPKVNCQRFLSIQKSIVKSFRGDSWIFLWEVVGNHHAQRMPIPPLSHSLTHLLTRTLSLTLSHTHTLTHTQTLSLSLSPPWASPPHSALSWATPSCNKRQGSLLTRTGPNPLHHRDDQMDRPRSMGVWIPFSR